VTDDDDDVVRDGGPDGPIATRPRCTPTKPFDTPAPLALDADTETKSAIMTRDELEIFYLRGTGTPFQLRHAIRKSRDDAWSTVEAVSEALSPPAVMLGSLTLGGKKLHYWTLDAQSKGAPNWASRPKALAGGFSNGTKIAGVDRLLSVTEADEGAYWTSSNDVDGGGAESRVHRGTLQGNLIFSDFIVPNIHVTPNLDSDVVISFDELRIYFTSNRTEAGGDILRAQRTSRAEEFGPAVQVPELATDTVDRASWTSDDDCVLLMTRARHVLIAKRPL
jgi:hypothetical protein